MTLGKKLNTRQIGEIHAREFLGDETWIRWKTDYDSMLAYRKTLKGKPNDEQMVTIKMNSDWMEFYGHVLFHSARLALTDICPCTKCGQKRNK